MMGFVDDKRHYTNQLKEFIIKKGDKNYGTLGVNLVRNVAIHRS